MRAKRLVWNELSHNRWIAFNVLGTYSVVGCHDGEYQMKFNGGNQGKYLSLEDAQAACQQEFDRIWREMTEEST